MLERKVRRHKRWHSLKVSIFNVYCDYCELLSGALRIHLGWWKVTMYTSVYRIKFFNAYHLPSLLGTPYQGQTASIQTPEYEFIDSFLMPCMLYYMYLVWWKEVEICRRVCYNISFVGRISRGVILIPKPGGKELIRSFKIVYVVCAYTCGLIATILSKCFYFL